MITSRIKVPSVVVLILLGILSQFLLSGLDVKIPDLSSIITILGTVGLILIVLEASLEIKITRENKKMFPKAFVSAFLIISLSSVLIYLVLRLFFPDSGKNLALIGIAVSIISSAIVIPSIASVHQEKKLYLTLESAFSDVIGVVLFNFVERVDSISLIAVGGYFLQIIIMLFGAIIAVIVLGVIMKTNTSKIRYFIILASILLIYGVSKYYHFSALILVLLFGLSLANFDTIKRLIPIDWIKKIELGTEIAKFEEMNNEIAFVVRTFFFILFGLSISFTGLGSVQVLLISAIILAVLYVSRMIVIYPSFRKSKNITTLVFAAPRGLITILLFYQISLSASESVLANCVNIVVFASIIIMTFVIFFSKKEIPET
jgi:NhaP-type Na+/H+ or K+/H+ antiporter